MIEFYCLRVKYVIGLDGSLLMIVDLLVFGIKCWVICCKVEVVVVVCGGFFLLEEVCSCYILMVDEFFFW